MPEEETERSVSARAVAVWVAAGVIGLALGGALVWNALERPFARGADRAELEALRTHAERVLDEIGPIAVAFSAEPTTAPVDVTAYRSRVDAVRGLVDSTNGFDASTSDTVEVRDLIATGGSLILDGFEQALDALQSDDVTAAAEAAMLVQEGSDDLQAAQERIDALLRGF